MKIEIILTGLLIITGLYFLFFKNYTRSACNKNICVCKSCGDTCNCSKTGLCLCKHECENCNCNKEYPEPDCYCVCHEGIKLK